MQVVLAHGKARAAEREGIFECFRCGAWGPGSGIQWVKD